MNQIEVGLGHAAIMEHADELLNAETHLAVDFDKRLVAHVKSSHHLKHGDLNGEIEGRDHRNRSKRPSVSLTLLTVVVSRVLEGSSKEPYIVTSKILKEFCSYHDFSSGLGVRFGTHSLNEPCEEVKNFFLLKQRCSFV